MIEEYKFDQYKCPISINDKDIKEIVGSNKFRFSKQDFKCFIGYKELKKLGLYVYSVHKWLYIIDI